MRAELRTLWSPDVVGGSLADYSPTDPTDFGLFVQTLIGPADGEGAESFEFIVCSPSWLARQPYEKGFRWGHGKLIIPFWKAVTVERAIRDLCLHTEGDDWTDIAERLARFGVWEFADQRHGAR